MAMRTLALVDRSRKTILRSIVSYIQKVPFNGLTLTANGIDVESGSNFVKGNEISTSKFGALRVIYAFSSEIVSASFGKIQNPV
jgi:hypothetical protein